VRTLQVRETPGTSTKGAWLNVGLFDRWGGEHGHGATMRESGVDAVQLVIDYLKQEASEPLQGVGRYFALGVAGSIAMSLGVVLLLLALLRFLQTETDTAFTGNLSWIPYLIVTVVAVGIAALCIWRVTKGPAARRRPASDERGL
jgi:hypothetical protein